jgi:hypothetical protein
MLHCYPFHVPYIADEFVWQLMKVHRGYFEIELYLWQQ